MLRLATLPLCLCLAAPLVSGCQMPGSQTARATRSEPAAVLKGSGRTPSAELVSGRSGDSSVRFASRKAGSSLPGVGSGTRSARIPLPKTAARDIDADGSDHQIGAF